LRSTRNRPANKLESKKEKNNIRTEKLTLLREKKGGNRRKSNGTPPYRRKKSLQKNKLTCQSSKEKKHLQKRKGGGGNAGKDNPKRTTRVRGQLHLTRPPKLFEGSNEVLWGGGKSRPLRKLLKKKKKKGGPKKKGRRSPEYLKRLGRQLRKGTPDQSGLGMKEHPDRSLFEPSWGKKKAEKGMETEILGGGELTDGAMYQVWGGGNCKPSLLALSEPKPLNNCD